MRSWDRLSCPAIALLNTTNEPVVFAVMPDPEPDDISTVLDSYGPVVNADPDRAHPANPLEVKGRMLEIGLQQFVAAVGDSLNRLWKQ